MSASRVAWSALLVLAVAVQLVGLYAPRGPDLGGVDLPAADKLGHAAMFAAVVLAGLRAGIAPRWVIGLSLAHAGVSELVQHLVLPDRSGDVLDLLADAAGVGLGALAARGLSDAARRRSGRGR